MRAYYDEYVRSVPPINWMKEHPEPDRTKKWQAMYDRPKSRPNDTESSRPVTYLRWLLTNYPHAWFDEVVPDDDNAGPSRSFLSQRRGMWHCYGAEHGYIMIHKSERRRVFAILRLMCGQILERSVTGGIRWADITLTHYMAQLRANTVRGQDILRQIWRILEPDIK